MWKNFFISITIIVIIQYQGLTQTICKIHEKDTEKVHFSELFKSASIVRLETGKNCLISAISSVKVDSDRIFIFDRKLESIFMFGRDGQFLKKIGSKGKGPGQYNVPSDILLDRGKRNIEILDYNGKRILIFDYNGNFLGSEKSLMVMDFEKARDNLYIGYSYNKPIVENNKISKSILVAYNNEGKIVDEYDKIGEIPRSINPITCSNMFSDENNDIYIVPILEYSLFRIDRSLQISKICDFKFDSKIPPKALSGVNNTREALQRFLDLDVPFFIINPNLIKDKLSLTFNFRREVYRFFWNMKSEKSITVSNSNFINDIALVNCYGFIGAHDNGLIDVIPAEELIKAYSSISVNGFQKQILNSEISTFEEIVKDISPIDNPILIFYDYKEGSWE